MAWNINQITGFNDDGEKWAGKKVLEILTANGDEGVLCVARWYGGIMLGPVRFDHIVHVAADALATYHLSIKNKSPTLASPSMIAPKVFRRGGEERERLVKALKGKDMTIENLRGMITEKKVERGEESPVASPVKEKYYERMEEGRLKRLVIARDATIKSLRDIFKELNHVSMKSEVHQGNQDKVEGLKD